MSKAITAATGAKVAVWRRADAGSEAPSAEGVSPGEPELVEQVLDALAGATAKRILLVIGPTPAPGTRIDVIPLEHFRNGAPASER